MDRVPTGVKGFDYLIQGGFPKGSAILLSGSPGTGKTIFGLEYIYRGANDFGEKGMFISFEQSPDDIREQSRQMGFENIERLENEGLITFACMTANLVDKHTAMDIFEEIKERKAERVVVDSLSALSINAPVYTMAKDMLMSDVMDHNTVFSPPVIGEDLKKNFIYKFMGDMKKLPVTAVLLSEIPDNSDNLSSDGVSEFVADGVVVVKKNTIGEEVNRTIHIEKMRMTRIGSAMKEFDFGDGMLIR